MRRRGRAKGSAEPACARHRNTTQLTCARCGKPICPRCLVQTPVGFMCDDHPGAPVKRAEDLPLTSKFRPLGARTPQPPPMTPMVGLLLFPAMLLLAPLFSALTGGSAAGVFLLPTIVITIIYFVARRSQRRR